MTSWKWLTCGMHLLKTLQHQHSKQNLNKNYKSYMKYGQQWLTEIQNSYNIYKTTLNLEPYLTTLEPKHAIPMCKFRANNHWLPIVTGRYKNVDRSERHCNLCTMDELGDIIFVCFLELVVALINQGEKLNFIAELFV